jgi:hypothetical protein
MENSLWKTLQTCHKTDNRMNEHTQEEKVFEDDQHEAEENKKMQ